MKKESDLAADVEEQQAALQAKAAEKKTQEPAAAVEQIPDQPSVKVTSMPLLLQHLTCCLYLVTSRLWSDFHEMHPFR